LRSVTWRRMATHGPEHFCRRRARHQVSRMFQLVFNVVKEIAPGLQVVITEHADINEDSYQASIAECWRGGRNSFLKIGRVVGNSCKHYAIKHQQNI
jgi:hypothetical protein